MLGVPSAIESSKDGENARIMILKHQQKGLVTKLDALHLNLIIVLPLKHRGATGGRDDPQRPWSEQAATAAQDESTLLPNNSRIRCKVQQAAIPSIDLEGSLVMCRCSLAQVEHVLL